MPAGDRTDPGTSFSFLVEIDGITPARFADVLGVSASAHVIDYREGGQPGVRKLVGPIDYGNITLRKGITASRELFEWWRSVADGQVQRKKMSIVLLDGEGREAGRWNVRDAWPCRYEILPFSSTGSSAAIESLEIAHEGLDRVA